MADIRIKDLATTASTTASDDFMAVDGTTNGTRKLSAATPSFATSVTVPGVSGPTATNLTLAGGSTGASLVLGQGANGNATITPSGTGKILSGTTGSEGGVGLSAFSVGTATGLGGTAYRVSSFYSTAAAAADRPGVILGFDTAGAGVIAAATQATGQPLAFWTYNGSAWGEKMRIATTGNLLIGTTTDISGTGGLKVAGTSTASSTTSGALQVGSNVGLSGNAGGASYFGGALTVVGDTSIGTNGFKIDTTNTRILLGLASALQGDTLEVASKADGGSISLFGRASDNGSTLSFRANGAATRKGNISANDSAVSIAAGSTVRLSIASSTGDVSLSSSTAGSAGAGALVVTGGISAGNNGNASYFGGAVTVNGTGTSTFAGAVSSAKTTATVASGSVSVMAGTSAVNGIFQEWKTNTSAQRAYIGTADQVVTGGVIADFAIDATSGNLVLSTAQTTRATISSTGATFAGAVAIGNTVNTVSPTSPNRTVTMVIGGVTYYLAAKTTND